MDKTDKFLIIIFSLVITAVIATCICSTFVDIEKEKTKQYELRLKENSNSVVREEN